MDGEEQKKGLFFCVGGTFLPIWLQRSFNCVIAHQSRHTKFQSSREEEKAQKIERKFIVIQHQP